MSEKMRRFLHSIGLEDPESLDIDFVSVKRDAKGTTLFVVTKESPWDFSSLSLFLEGLSRIAYPYSMSFVYDCEIHGENVSSLYRDWYISTFRDFPSIGLKFQGGKPVFGEDVETSAKKEFLSLLDFLSYKGPFEGEEIEEAAEEPVVEEIPPEPEEVPEPYFEVDEEVERQKKEAEMSYLREMEVQRRESLKRSNSGDYVRVNSIAELLTYSSGSYEFSGFAYESNPRATKGGKMSNTVSVGDDTGGIQVKMLERQGGLSGERIMEFGKIEKAEEMVRMTFRGRMEVDKFSGEPVLFCEDFEPAPPLPLRTDNAVTKRVELHLHTKMSAMDGTGDILDYCKAAKAMGMSAIAVTDHGDIQAFPEAESAGAKTGLKIIYGCEFYMFDFPVFAYRPNDVVLSKGRYCVFDFETTGLSNKYDRITEFGAVIIENGLVINRIDFFVNAGMEIPPAIVAKTHITNEMIQSGLSEEEAVEKIEKFMEGTILVSHNAAFDVGFLNDMRRRMGKGEIENPVVDTLAISYYLFPEAGRHNLGALSRNLGLELYDEKDAHRADYDAEVLSKVWEAIIVQLEKDLGKPGLTLRDLDNIPVKERRGIFKHLRTRHIIALAKNQEGLKSLYRLVSDSSTEFLATGQTPIPKIPREEIEKERDNLLLGSACFNGEVFVNASEKSSADLEKAISFYDYIELQPKENYNYLINVGDLTEDRLDSILLDIADTAERMGKKVVATGDAHYVDPRDKVTRDVYIATLGLGQAPHPLFPMFRTRLPHFENPDQHLRTTTEMLDCFHYLGEERAYRYVVTNSLWVADQIGQVKICKDHLYAPDSNLPGSDQKLRDLCYENLRKTYGDHPDPIIVERLEKELNGIISNGYSVTYYIAHLICKKVLDDGYVFGSRGSVGSSFVATMAGVTEVNPLAAHYVCPHCHHFEWSEDPDIRSGFDLPEKKCPECGTDMKRDGQNIPFETFLGFHAEKVPDIDLNFPPDYQAVAHAFTRELLSTPEENKLYAEHKEVKNPHVIRAGTVSTAEKKNAFGYIKRFYYPRFLGHEATDSERLYNGYLAVRCVGVKKTTGQHPGGIVVIPTDMDIFDFTAYQHPADNPNAEWLTTHYAFESLHDSVLKLDLLGHVDPQALRMMSLLTGVNIYTIPYDDKKVLSLFSSTAALGLRNNPLKFKTGAIAFPEFGTNFVQGILEETKPKTFNDLLIVSGLSHGTNVWDGNAQAIVKRGEAKLSEVIGCRDDIMTYLISKGLDSGTAFQIMEFVRKNKAGNPLKEEHVAAMREHGVPEFYIDSCRKIRYLFPRAHATAYTIGAWRVGWFKLYYPLEFYAAYFTCRCDKFDIKAMTSGYEGLLKSIEILKAKTQEHGEHTPADDEILKSSTAAMEMLDRGFKVENINLMESESENWVVSKERNCVIPPFKAISGFPVKTAEAIVEERKKGPFLSKEDFREKTGAGESVVKSLEEYKVLDGLEESNQMSLFDFSF